MPIRILRRALLGLTALSLIATPAAAQAGGDVSVGYSFMSIDEGGKNENIPLGWTVSFAGPGTISAVADIGGHYGGSRFRGWKQHTFQGGVRFSFRENPRVVPFVQIVGGLAGGGTRRTHWNFTVQPGAGIDVFPRDGGPGFRAQIDFPAYLGIDGFFTARLTVGIVIPLT